MQFHKEKKYRGNTSTGQSPSLDPFYFPFYFPAFFFILFKTLDYYFNYISWVTFMSLQNAKHPSALKRKKKLILRLYYAHLIAWWQEGSLKPRAISISSYWLKTTFTWEGLFFKSRLLTQSKCVTTVCFRYEMSWTPGA